MEEMRVYCLPKLLLDSPSSLCKTELESYNIDLQISSQVRRRLGLMRTLRFVVLYIVIQYLKDISGVLVRSFSIFEETPTC